MAIGQGYLLTTPLQVNFWTNSIANGGKLCKPTMKKATAVNPIAGSCQDLQIAKETLRLITRGMERACQAGGTGWPLFDFQVPAADLTSEYKQDGDVKVEETASPSGKMKYKKVPVACKTGTAEFGSTTDSSGQAKTHAWFTAFAPIPKELIETKGDTMMVTGEPEISVTVLVEEGGEGSSVAGPVAKKILEAWFGR